LCHHDLVDATIVLGKQGRLVIPADLRTALGLKPGDHLRVRLDGNHMVLERQEDAVRELRALGDSVPRSRSLVDELLAERRAAAANE